MKYLSGLSVFVVHAAWAVTCPALTIVKDGHSLCVTGGQGIDVIEIVDNGAGSICVGGTEYHGIRSLAIDARGGDDTVTYDTVDQLSLSKIHIDLGPGNDSAELNLGIVAADVQSEIRGGSGRDMTTTRFGEVLAGVNAESLMDGGLGDDTLACMQQDVAGSATCMSRGGAGDDRIFCHAENVLEGGEAICISDGGIGDDTIACAKANVAGYASCVSDGGAGDDDLSCVLDLMTDTGSALCHQTGGLGNDTLRCETSDVLGEHVCYEEGGPGNDVVNSIVRGNNGPDSECTLYGGLGNDLLIIELGTFETAITVKSGPVSFFADAGPGDDHFFTTGNLTYESDATITDVTVLMGAGNDTATLDYFSLGGAVLEAALYDGGRGVDTYEGTLQASDLPVVNFEIGVD